MNFHINICIKVMCRMHSLIVDIVDGCHRSELNPDLD